MANKYANLVGTNKIKDEYTKINTGFDRVEVDINKLKTDVTAVNTRVDTIITTPISGQAATQEIVDARVSAVKSKTFASLDARFEETEQDIATHKADKAAHGGIYHKNLLHNWDFRNPVNQRGQTEYTPTGYSIDRWRLAGQGIVRIKNGSIELESIGTDRLYFTQTIENPQLYDGKTVTVSAEINGQIYSGTGVINLSQGINPLFATITLSEGYVQMEYVTDAKWLRFRFAVSIGRKISNITRVKLEFGSISTLANDPPADYGEQLALCQRYYQTISRDPVGMGYISSAGTTAYIAVPTPVTMRTTPTLVGATAGDFKIRQKATDITPTGLDIVKYDNLIVLRFTVEGATAREIAGAWASKSIALSADL